MKILAGLSEPHSDMRCPNCNEFVGVVTGFSELWLDPSPEVGCLICNQTANVKRFWNRPLGDFLVALYHVCAHFHSGQESDGYRIMGLAHMYYERWFGSKITLDNELSPAQFVMYSILKDKYGGSL